MQNINEDKKLLRKKIKSLQSQYTFEDRKKYSENIWAQLEENTVFKEAETVMLYWSMSDEVYTHDLIQKWYPRKIIVLPSVEGDILRLKLFQGIQHMKSGENFGIQEPVGEDFDTIQKLDLVIVPGMAFDKHNNRMGRGKGYYDKLFHSLNVFKIGVCFHFQLFENIPTNDFDIKMNEVISDTYFD